MAELKSCPFCGGEAKLTKYKDGVPLVVCSKCMAHTCLCFSVEEAVERWNKRN